MIIDLASVTSVSKPVAADVEGAQIDLDDEGSVSSPVHFNGEILRDGSRVHLRGTVTGDVDLQCTRCAEPLRHHLDVSFDDVFVPASDAADAGEHELEGAELDEQIIEQDEIDLTDVIREQVLLNLPEQVFCKEDCKGLCPQCGTDLNKTDCDCGENEIDPRWAALKNLN